MCCDCDYTLTEVNFVMCYFLLIFWCSKLLFLIRNLKQQTRENDSSCYNSKFKRYTEQICPCIVKPSRSCRTNSENLKKLLQIRNVLVSFSSFQKSSNTSYSYYVSTVALCALEKWYNNDKAMTMHIYFHNYTMSQKVSQIFSTTAPTNIE